jgi:putative transposase
MARPQRIEFPGAIYHITSSGKSAFGNNTDRTHFLAVLAHTMERFDAKVLAYCIMGDHYQLALYTRQANLSKIMRQINAVYTQNYNRRHASSGPVFQGRFKAVLVDREAYLLELCRDIELTPVRAGKATTAEQWSWSSHLAHTGQVTALPWLDTPGLHQFIFGRAPTTARDRTAASQRYAKWVSSAPKTSACTEGLQRQIYLGDDAFVERMQALAVKPSTAKNRETKAQRKKTVEQWLKSYDSVDEALYRGYCEGGLTMSAMAIALERTTSWASKAITRFEKRLVASA